jgi:hypothetical protein
MKTQSMTSVTVLETPSFAFQLQLFVDYGMTLLGFLLLIILIA